jgi:uncharacterized protein (DUF302 family)
MKKEFTRNLAIVLAWMLLILAATGQAAWAQNATPYPGTVIAKTAHSYKDLVTRLDAAVTANKMGLVSRASATRPDFAVRMLEASVAAGIEAPLRFYITENADGTATLTYRKPSAVFAPYEVPALDEMAKELDEIFAKIAAAATGV